MRIKGEMFLKSKNQIEGGGFCQLRFYKSVCEAERLFLI